MFRRILIPTDLTDRTIRAIHVARDVQAPHDSRLMLLHVIETVTGAEFEELSSFYGTLEKQAWNRLHDIATRASVPHAQIDAHVVFGKRVEETLKFARVHQVELIVLASHPIDPVAPASSIGTMSYKLGILAPCAVLLVK
jgi:nucleotide-binding universal stress UspA family protein